MEIVKGLSKRETMPTDRMTIIGKSGGGGGSGGVSK